MSYNRALGEQRRASSEEVCELLLAMSDTKSPVPSAGASLPNGSTRIKIKKRSTADADNACVVKLTARPKGADPLE